MWAQSSCISAGDVVILWLTREDVQSIVVTPGKELNGRYGVYRHADLVGVPYGSKLSSRNGRGFIHVLRPTPELWTLALPHRTQILYHADISYIAMWLAIKPGSVVIEAGTGSGSFSHSVARTIGPTGRLYSFEFHEQRANKARDEFNRHGMSDFVTLEHRNVCKDGFGLQDKVDSVFLDLPAPWEAVASAGNALRKDRIGRICCFSPCMEQVLRTVSALNELGFTGVTTHETLLRPHDVCNTPMQTVGEVAARLRNIEVRKEQRRRKQIETSNRDKKRKRPEETSEDQLEDVAKKAKKEGLSVGEPEAQNGNPPLAPVPEPDLSGGVDDAKSSTKDALKSKRTPHHPNAIIPVNSSAERYIVSKPFSEIRGHTSYLTFAILVPSSPRSGVAPEGTTANGSSPADGLQNSNPAVYDAQSIDETTAAFDSLIDGIPEEELERMLNPEL
ncbi:tRNA (adenine-N(1)-)-methyltransferase catalytic subunit trm61 [Ceratobasidium sp. 428]|nr:tRNA (adenine-N(1)-)-methyltransferase catalytic subunit trm61 [Ceratobasidium sp. 428]